jgi:hypothetical protein
MHKFLNVFTIICISVLPAAAFSQQLHPGNDPVLRDVEAGNSPFGTPVPGTGEIRHYIELMDLVKSERLSRSDVYVYKRTVTIDGKDATEYWKRFRAIQPSGQEVETMYPVTKEEAGLMEVNENADLLTAYFFEAYAAGLITAGAALDSKNPFTSGSAQENASGAGLLLDAGNCEEVIRTAAGEEGYSETFAIGAVGGVPFSATAFFLGPACFSYSIGQQIRAGREQSDVLADARREISAHISAAGTELIDGRRSIIAEMSDLNMVQRVDDGSATIDKCALSIDEELYTLNRFRCTGERDSGDGPQPFFIETVYWAYRYVPGTLLFEPHRETLRMGGLLSDAERAQMQEAKAQLEEFEEQLAAMPANQRAMMENMMGSQMQQIRSLADSGAIEVQRVIESYEVNPNSSGGQTITPLSTDEELLQFIQRHLLTLGYDPGNTDGQLTKTTVVAITRYEADNGMDVTGQATPQLAGILSAAVDAMN